MMVNAIYTKMLSHLVSVYTTVGDCFFCDNFRTINYYLLYLLNSVMSCGVSNGTCAVL